MFSHGYNNLHGLMYFEMWSNWRCSTSVSAFLFHDHLDGRVEAVEHHGQARLTVQVQHLLVNHAGEPARHAQGACRDLLRELLRNDTTAGWDLVGLGVPVPQCVPLCGTVGR